jgi:ABC-type Fe3+-hydroxamate transport system substrate-binding protein
MKKLYIILGLVLIISAAAASVYALYYMPNESSEPTPSATPTPTASPSAEPTASATPTASPSESPNATSTPEPTATPTPTSVTVVDNRGVSVTVQYPVQRIVSIEAGITEIICALGGEDKIIGIQSPTVN